MKDAECAELDCNNARFGFAIANAKDIDGDGYNGQFVSGLNLSPITVFSRI